MLRYKYKLSHRLESVLLKYQTLANSNPQRLRLLVPAHELWRIFVDGERQAENSALDDCFDIPVQPHHTFSNYPGNRRGWKELLKYLHLNDDELTSMTLSDLQKFNKGWFLFERSEPGYLKALYWSFNEIFDTSEAFDLDLIKWFHRKATERVNRTNYNLFKDASKNGHLRNRDLIGFQLTTSNASMAGIYEILERNDRFATFFAAGVGISAFSLSENRHFQLVLNGVKQEFRTLFSNLSSDKSNASIAGVLYEFIEKYENDPELKLYFVSMQEDNPELELEEDANHFIQEYYARMRNSKDFLEKLSVIVWLVQRLEQLHMFDDANCRTLVMLTLNFLLIRNGFPFSILQQPNKFDAYSHEELIAAVIKGMENTFELIEEKQLFDIKTSDMLDLLKGSNTLGASKDYFDEVVKVEDRARRRVVNTLFGSTKRKREEDIQEVEFSKRYKKNAL